MSTKQQQQSREPIWKVPDPPIAVLVMLAEEEDQVVMIDLSTHPCGQQIVDDYAAGTRLVSADHLSALGTSTDPARPV